VVGYPGLGKVRALPKQSLVPDQQLSRKIIKPIARTEILLRREALPRSGAYHDQVQYRAWEIGLYLLAGFLDFQKDQHAA
jgi:hypothetical protein